MKVDVALFHEDMPLLQRDRNAAWFTEENGNKMNVRWATLSDLRGRGLLVLGHPTLNVTAQHYRVEDLVAARHIHELTPRPQTVLHLDYRQAGVGNSNLGPGTFERYQVKPEPMDFAVRLMPLVAGTIPPGLLWAQAPQGV